MEKAVVEHLKERIQAGEYTYEREMKPLPRGLGGRILEVGCGARLTYSPGRSETFGCDVTTDMIMLFKKKYRGAHAIVSDARMLPFRRESFDVIVSNDLLHHLVGSSPVECRRNIACALREMKRISKSGGTLLIREYLARNYLLSLVIFYSTLLCARFGIEIGSFDIHSKIITFFLTEKEFKKISSENGLTAKETEQKDWMLMGNRFLKRVKIGTEAEFLLEHG